ncbi:creatininase family protein [Paenibacillus agaridevorans]|uniref:creatininase family protein n=1 Tax=Paenibacillus agaridevorans TaxID=171404 RepID=UPI001BE44377|nr:creatininase family protein [Paenibacillus agaridevorans]
MSLSLFHSKTRTELSKLAAAGSAVLVPLAATEQHGPHLPVYTDSLICEHICEEAIGKLKVGDKILLAPAITIGCSQHHLAYGGTLSYRSSTFLAMLQDIGESLVACGFRRIIFLNGHGGNESIMLQAVNDLIVKHPIGAAAASYWSLVPVGARNELAKETGGPMPGHAGAFETALVKAMRPDWVHEEAISLSHASLPWQGQSIPGTLLGTHGLLTGQDGYTDAPFAAQAAAGQLSLKVIAEHVARWLEQTLNTMKIMECPR